MKRYKKNKVEFSKFLCAIIAGALFFYAIYAGFAFYSQVTMYYQAVNNAIKAGTEYVSISQPDSTLAVTCVTCILASFLTYCLYQFGLKNSLNKHNLSYDEMDGIVKRIASGDAKGAIENISKLNNRENQKDDTKKPSQKVKEDNSQETIAG